MDNNGGQLQISLDMQGQLVYGRKSVRLYRQLGWKTHASPSH
jgi:hypothetical protein